MSWRGRLVRRRTGGGAGRFGSECPLESSGRGEARWGGVGKVRAGGVAWPEVGGGEKEAGG